MILGCLSLSLSAGKAWSSVDAWYCTSLDIEEVISGTVDGYVHLFVADVVKSFDTVDRNIIDCVLFSGLACLDQACLH